jgi:hypothetical protein
MSDVVPAVYAKIAAVSAELAQVGISKGRKNQQQGYSFRGIDDVLNALAPMLSNAGLVILPRCLSRASTERETQKGGTLFYVVVEAAFDFVAAVDASVHTVVTFGEAMDSADKATNKAMSAAYKYAAILAFCIPVVGEDADAVTHEVAGRVTSPVTPPPASVTRPVTPESSYRPISEGQQKRFFAISKEKNWQPSEVKALLKKVLNVEQSAQIPVNRYEELVKLLELGPSQAA